MGIFDSILPIRQLLPTQIGARIDIGSLLGLGSAPDPSTSPFNIDEFRTSLLAHGELAKQDKFHVMFHIPAAVQLATGTTSRELTLLCEAAEFPGRDINVIEYRHYGFIKRLPHNNQYGQLQFTFISTGDFWEKRLFDRWMDLMVPTESGLVTYPLDAQGNKMYETTIVIFQYNQTGDVIYIAGVNDAIPTSMTPMSLDWSNDSPHKLVMTFNFRQWVSDSTDAKVTPTDFGQAVGGQVSVSPVATNPINNQTNNVPNSPLVNGIFNAGITTGERLLSSFKLKL